MPGSHSAQPQSDLQATLRRSTGAAGVEGPAQGHLGGGKERRASAAFYFPQPLGKDHVSVKC